MPGDTAHRAVHTVEYLRKHSTVLFSAILAASSKFYKKELYDTLIGHTNAMTSRAIWVASEDTSLVQTLCILVFWKAPMDSTAWRRIGYSPPVATTD